MCKMPDWCDDRYDIRKHSPHAVNNLKDFVENAMHFLSSEDIDEVYKLIIDKYEVSVTNYIKEDNLDGNTEST